MHDCMFIIVIMYEYYTSLLLLFQSFYCFLLSKVAANRVFPGCEERVERVMLAHPNVTDIIKFERLLKQLELMKTTRGHS